MIRPWEVLLCILLVQRAVSQALCQSDLYISMDDLLRAISNGQLNPNQGNIGQDVCGCQNLPLPNQGSCGCQNSLNQQPFFTSSQTNLFGNQPSFQPSFQANQLSGCGCQQPSIAFANQPIQQNYQPSFSSFNQLSCGRSQQPTIPFANQPSFALGNQLSQQIISQNQQSCGCGQQLSNQPSIFNNLSGYQPSLSQNQQSALSLLSQQTSSCGQQSLSANRPSLSLQRGSSNQQSYAQPTSSLNSLSQQSCQQSGQSQQSSNQCSSQNANVGNNIVIPNVDNFGSNVASVVPNALLQAPPFGIFFEGENLIIDGAVQVCGSMPFTTAVQISGMMPASGIGNVQYTCGEIC